MPSITLHQWEISPFCGKVRRVLQQKGLTYEVKNYNGLRALEAKLLSPRGKLPVLDLDGKRILDSSTIVRVLEERFPDPPLLPSDPVKRAEARVWEDWADESLFWFEVFFRFRDREARKRSVVLLCEGRPRAERWLLGAVTAVQYASRLKAQGLGKLDGGEVREQLIGHLDALETILSSRDCLVGDRVSVADLAVVSQLSEIARTSSMRGEIDARPKLSAWRKRLD